jgi:hypothetical protein
MLGLNFWKHAIAQTTAYALAGRPGDRRRRLRVGKIVVLVAAAVAALAFVIGMPLVGLSAYLLKTLPFTVFAS